MVSKDPKKRPDITEIYKHSWLGNIPKMNPEELEKHENDINLKQELKKRFLYVKLARELNLVKNIEII